MAKSYVPLLVSAAAALGILVWLDNKPNMSGSDVNPVAPNLANDQATKMHTTAELKSVSQSLAGAHPRHPANPLAELDKGLLRDTVNRPLFSASRRPPQVVQALPPPVIKQKNPPPVEYKLLGVAGAGNRKIALLGNRSDGRNFRVEVGDMLSGWSVSSITSESVHLERQDGSVTTIYLFKGSDAPP